jgi:hypothetical protein
VGEGEMEIKKELVAEVQSPQLSSTTHSLSKFLHEIGSTHIGQYVRLEAKSNPGIFTSNYKS